MQINSSMRYANVSGPGTAVRGGAPRARTQKKTFGQKLGNFAKGVAQVGLSVAGATVPGASVLTNAIGGAFGANLAGGGGLLGGAAGGTGAAGGSMVAEMAAMNTRFLALQNAVQMESRKFQTLSNASKARHDIAMNAIRNTRA